MKQFFKTKKWLCFSISFLFFFLLLAFVWFKKDLYIDTLIYRFLMHFKSDRMTSIALIITSIGNPGFFVFFSILLFLANPNRKIAKSLLINLIIITITNNVIKFIVSRPRPIGINMIEEWGYSFPSAHAMVSVAFYGLIIFYLCHYMKNKNLKYFLSFLIGCFIFLICLSRIYLGVHYASDVLAGVFLSLSYLICYIHVLEKKWLK